MVLFLVMRLSVAGQVSIVSMTLNEERLSPSTLFSAVVNNIGEPVPVRIEGGLRTIDGEVVLDFISDPFLISTGTSNVRSDALNMRTFLFSSSGSGRYARMYQRLPGGRYESCIRLISDVTEVDDRYCDEVVVDDMLFLDLVVPLDGDTIDDVRPSLTWMITGAPSLAVPAGIRLVLVPMERGLRPAQAVAASVPIFQIPELKQRTVPYPNGVADLQRGKCYAWQVERLSDRRVIDRSEPWGFCVRQWTDPVPEKYVHLDRLEPGAIYDVVDDRIFFRYDEPYAPTVPVCTVRDGDQVVVPRVIDERGGGQGAGLRAIGTNLYALDLHDYSLRTGYYELVVEDGKGRLRTMKFRIER